MGWNVAVIIEIQPNNTNEFKKCKKQTITFTFKNNTINTLNNLQKKLTNNI